VPDGPGLPACLPPQDLTGLDPSWSRLVRVGEVTWHILERPADTKSDTAGGGDPEVTVLAVHGNPTWSYLWRRLLLRAPGTWRVIAVDQIGMGYSQRLPGPRRLAQRIDDLGALTEVLDVRGPVVTVAHDWGGPVSLGWALQHREHLLGCVLTNTAVHQPAGARTPELIRLARWSPVRSLLTQKTPVFTRGTTTLSAVRSRRLPADVVAGFQAPYRSAQQRRAVADFVADIPLEDDHPSAVTLDAIAEGVQTLDVPVLLAWGADDPVFSDRYLRDLVQRIPHADVHRYERAGHLVTEDAPESIDDIIDWISHRAAGSPSIDVSVPAISPNAALAVARSDDGIAIAELGEQRTVTWQKLNQRVQDLSRGLADLGVRAGDRVSLLIPPGADLVASVYACWSLGAAVVVADRGLGLAGMRRAIRGAAPDHVIAIAPGLAITRDIEIPGLRILAGSAAQSRRRVLKIDATLVEVARTGERRRDEAEVDSVPDDLLALIAFTSGSTGPAKGVVYTRARVAALVDAITQAYAIDPGHDALIAAFAPWAVLGPALGIPSAIPDMDVTDPSTLTMESFTDAADAVGGTIAWTSPTGVRALVDTAADTTRRPRNLRLLMVAGAPTSLDALDAMAQALPDVRIATPYGMTEALPLTQVDLPELQAAGAGPGVLVGRPLEGVQVRIAQLDALGQPATTATDAVDITGEIVVRAPWMKQAYDRRWGIQHRTGSDGWHRTGDVGRLDDLGRLWIEGRLSHVITTPNGPVTPVAAEDAAARVAGTALAACVGVGPRGRQVVAIVLPTGVGGGRKASGRSLDVADVDTTVAVRAAVEQRCGVDIAAVLTMNALPVDIRHRSKIDRSRVARLASAFLAGSAAKESP